MVFKQSGRRCHGPTTRHISTFFPRPKWVVPWDVSRNHWSVPAESVPTVSTPRLRREHRDQQGRQLAWIKCFVTSAAVVELAVVRRAELRCDLNSMGGTSEQMQEQARQMMHFCNAISRHACERYVGRARRVSHWDSVKDALVWIWKCTIEPGGL